MRNSLKSPLIVLGITGGSGTGKTAASEMFGVLGVKIIDADKVARKVVEKGKPALREIVDFFGKEILQSDGTLDRKKLGGIVFSCEEKLSKLNSITHKYISEYVYNEIATSEGGIIGIDGAVLIESEIAKQCDYICSVLADKKIRINRIMERDNLSYDETEKRMNSQKCDEFYIKNSDFVIYNNTTIINLQKQVEEIAQKLKLELGR